MSIEKNPTLVQKLLDMFLPLLVKRTQQGGVMRRGLWVAVFVALALLFASGQAFSAAHRHSRHRPAIHHRHRAASTRHHSSIYAAKATGEAGTAGLATGSSQVSEDEPISLRSSKKRRLARASRRPAAEMEQVADQDQAESDEYIAYRVKRGDTLEKLAQQFSVDKDEIADLNKGMRRRLAPGCVLYIPKTQEDQEEAPIVLNDRPLKPWKNEEERGILVKVAKSFAGTP